MHKQHVTVFGEALFDCFANGKSILGGAPFNVAWHLQALGDAPQFISRIGQDSLGQQLLDAMLDWGFSTQNMQLDAQHKTGQVIVSIEDGEPHYDIAIDAAYDFIQYEEIQDKPDSGIFYHGTLAARNEDSAASLDLLTSNHALKIFVDVNLRDPWWQKAKTFEFLERATWVKLNKEELAVLGFKCADIYQDMTRMHNHFHLQHLIVTCGEQGAIVRDEHGEFHHVEPTQAQHVVDTVGAGDAFTAMYLHGLLAGWKVNDILEQAQTFASKVVGLQGAISRDPDFYKI